MLRFMFVHQDQKYTKNIWNNNIYGVYIMSRKVLNLRK